MPKTVVVVDVPGIAKQAAESNAGVVRICNVTLSDGRTVDFEFHLSGPARSNALLVVEIPDGDSTEIAADGQFMNYSMDYEPLSFESEAANADDLFERRQLGAQNTATAGDLLSPKDDKTTS